MKSGRCLRFLLGALVVIAAGQAGIPGHAETIGIPMLSVDGTGLAWTPAVGATAYQVIRGDLATLRQNGGSLRAATQACMAGFLDDYPLTSLQDTGVPKPGEGFFFLVRGVTATEAGTYDSGGLGQAGPRDQQIEAAVPACFSPVLPHDPILISGDGGFTAANGVVGGQGSPADPYVISGWQIACPSMDGPAAIQVSGTQASFVIRNVLLFSCQDGVLLDNAINGRIERFYGSDNGNGVRMISGGDAAIEGGYLLNNAGDGIGVFGATNVEIAGNSIDTADVGVHLDGASSCLVHRNNIASGAIDAIDQNGGPNAWNAPYPEGGNAWSGYQGADLCSGPGQDNCAFSDGFGDSPYDVAPGASDDYPRMFGYDPRGDTYPPIVSIQSPSDGLVVTAPFLIASGSASDYGSGLSRVEVRVNGGPWTVADGKETWYSLIAVATGVNSIEARSTDHAGYVSPVAAHAATCYDDPAWDSVLIPGAASYLPGEPVSVSLLVTNLSASPVTVHFPSTCQAMFQVRDEHDVVVYDQAHHVGCPLVLTERTWQPNETVTYNFTWYQVDDAGQPVPAPARYLIRGALFSTEPLPEGAAVISITSGPN